MNDNINFESRLYDGIISATFMAPISAGFGALVGFVCAKLVDLPANQVAKALAIWFAVEEAFVRLSTSFIEDSASKSLINATIFCFSTIYGLQELQARNLLNGKMTTFLIIIRVLTIAAFLIEAIFPEDSNE